MNLTIRKEFCHIIGYVYFNCGDDTSFQNLGIQNTNTYNLR